MDKVEIETLADIDAMFAESNNGYPIRVIKFPNGCYIKIKFNPGVIGESRLSHYPSLHLNGLDSENHSIRYAEFSVENHVGSVMFGGNNVGYPEPSKNGTIDDEFYNGLKPTKINFKRRFEDLILKVFV